MAISLNCPVCDRDNVNNAYCDGCKLALCEEIIGHLKQHILDGTPIPYHIVKVILSSNWMSIQEYLESRSKAESLEREKVAWVSRQFEATQQFIREWERKNPDPNPLQVGV